MSVLVPIPPHRECWIKTSEAAALLCVRPETLLSWNKTGRPGLPRAKRVSSKCYRWPKLALIRWLESTGQAEGQGNA